MLNILATCTVGGNSVDIPSQIQTVGSLIYGAITIGVPLLLIIFGMLDLGKAVIAQKEDEIKKGQQIFIKRLIAAAIVFFVFTIVRIVVGLVAGDDSGSILDCIDIILGGK